MGSVRKSSNSIKEPDKQQEEVAKEEKATTEIADKNKELELKNNKTDKNEESELESNLSSSENKKDTVESFLNSQLSDSETKKSWKMLTLTMIKQQMKKLIQKF